MSLHIFIHFQLNYSVTSLLLFDRLHFRVEQKRGRELPHPPLKERKIGCICEIWVTSSFESSPPGRPQQPCFAASTAVLKVGENTSGPCNNMLRKIRFRNSFRLCARVSGCEIKKTKQVSSSGATLRHPAIVDPYTERQRRTVGFARSAPRTGLCSAKCREPVGSLPGRVRVCRITLTPAKLTHRAIFTRGQGVDLLLRDFTALSAARGPRHTPADPRYHTDRKALVFH